MYNEQLEKLIEMALVDGDLTEKEKQILFKKAEAFGVDLDEFEMVLDAKLFEKQQSNKKVETPVAAAPKSDKFGDVRKCPACGNILQSFQTKCDVCGHEFANVEAVNSASKLFDLLQAATLRYSEKLSQHESDNQKKIDALIQKHNEEKQQLSIRHNSEGTFTKIVAGKSMHERQNEERDDLIASQEEQMKALEEALDKALDKIENTIHEEKANIIKNFPIPNAKEDLLELLAMATSNAYDNDGHIGKEEEVWIQKCDQIYSKINTVGANDPQLIDRSTHMIYDLMKRLPSKYKNFTQIAESMRDKIQAEKDKDKARLKESYIKILKGYGIIAGVCAVLIIIGIWVNFLKILGVIALVVDVYFCGKALKKAKNNQLN